MAVFNMNEAKTIIGDVLTEFGMIDSLLRSIYKQINGADAVHLIVSDGELDGCFFDFINSNPELALDTKSKLYRDQDGNSIHLVDLVQKLRQVLNIAAHQTLSLVTKLSSLPSETHRQTSDSYKGSIEDFQAMWRFYADQFLPIFEQWNSGGFDDQGFF